MRIKELQKKYDHALDSMWSLFKYGKEREELLEDELQRIKVVCDNAKVSNGGTMELIAEIEGICDRGLSS